MVTVWMICKILLDHKIKLKLLKLQTKLKLSVNYRNKIKILKIIKDQIEIMSNTLEPIL